MKTITVVGRPRPQGSLRTLLPLRGSKPITIASDPKVYDYRHDIQSAWLRAYKDEPPLKGPVLAHLTFVFARPASHYLPANSKRPAPVLRAEAPTYYAKKPDLDKLVRAVGDALTGFAYTDDCQIAQGHAAKVWGQSDHTIIEIMDISDASAA
jgi:crossover junction endodeoxyribonuclease RusA